MSKKKSNKRVRYRQVPDFPGYRVGDDGTVWTRKQRGTYVLADKWRELAIVVNYKGYRIVALCNKGRMKHFPIAKLVLLAFCGPKPTPKHETRHLDGVKTNNVLDNLAWGTRKENMADQYRHGTRVFGKRCHTCILTPKQVLAIRREYIPYKVLLRELAEKYGVSYSTVRAIITRRSWFWLEDEKCESQ